MWWLAIVPFAVQALAIVFDEGYFHIRRGLPKWERIGHPLDTLTVIACLAYVLCVPFSQTAFIGYIALAIFSTIFVTKDEFVHNQHCPATEQWLHALLFTLHPITLAIAGFIWNGTFENLHILLQGQLAMMILFLLYQIIYWNVVRYENN